MTVKFYDLILTFASGGGIIGRCVENMGDLLWWKAYLEHRGAVYCCTSFFLGFGRRYRDSYCNYQVRGGVFRNLNLVSCSWFLNGVLFDSTG